MKSQVDSTVDEKRDKSSKPPVVSFSMYLMSRTLGEKTDWARAI